MFVSDGASATLCLHLFGPFEALLNGAPLERRRSRKGDWLLALLTLRHGREVERAWLAGMLWPGRRTSEALALRREVGNRRGEAINRTCLGEVVLFRGDYEAARALCDQTLVILRELDIKRVIARSLRNQKEAAALQGDYAAARAHYEEAIAINQQIGNRRGEANCLSRRGEIALLQGDYPAAWILLADGLSIQQELGDNQGIAESLEASAWLAWRYRARAGRWRWRRPSPLREVTAAAHVMNAW